MHSLLLAGRSFYVEILECGDQRADCHNLQHTWRDGKAATELLLYRKIPKSAQLYLRYNTFFHKIWLQSVKKSQKSIVGLTLVLVGSSSRHKRNTTTLTVESC